MFFMLDLNEKNVELELMIFNNLIIVNDVKTFQGGYSVPC